VVADELYVNYRPQEDDEIYANDVAIELEQPPATSGTAGNDDNDDEGELYANDLQLPTVTNGDDDEDEGELYANDVVMSLEQPTVANGVAAAVDDDDDDGELYQNTTDIDRTADDEEGEMEEEYQNFDETGNTVQQQRPQSSERDDEPIYQNVSRKPKPAPKPARRF